ncbi:P-selectin [Odontesthes bonariensis]|uniref:P-selectin n=1 Tax=Odontesthes bonariensis TaxID=219752 RepID=UPI003F582F89
MSVGIRNSLHHWVLTAALILFARNLSSIGGAQAWMYNYSRGPNQQWHEARQWCQKHFTDMVAIQSQEEAEFLNNLLPRNPKYYWIGVHKVAGEWTWVRTNKNIPTEAQNWASGEPDDSVDQDCVEIYIKRERDTAKWNNEKCQKQKGALCYTASCTKDSCSAHADCVETVGSHTCKCYPGFIGPRCAEAIPCKPLQNPEQGSHLCIHPYGSSRFNSSCHFKCELGFRLIGTPNLQCQASGDWNHPVPLCHVEQCPALNHTDFSRGSMNCSHPISTHSYNSTCEFRCNEGYKLIGQGQIQCDHSGQWTASVPICTVKKCPTIVSPVAGSMTCVDTVEPSSFGSECDFTCQEGYYRSGDNTLTCLASEQWSKPTPTCAVVQCTGLQAPLHAFIQCQDPVRQHSYGSTCTVQCEEGFDQIGTNVTTCSSQGNWSHALPVCKAKRCTSIISPLHGSLSCSDPNGPLSFGSRCSVTCDEGFLLNGTARIDCTSLGVWSTDIPHCLAQRCATLNSPHHGSIFCSDPHGAFSFGSRCTADCEDGFFLNGTADTECTSAGTWNIDIPVCLAKRCPTLKSPPDGSSFCSGPHGEFSFGSRCTTTCKEGFVLNGTTDIECTAGSTWSPNIPQCLAKKCPRLTSPSHGSLVCSDPYKEFSFGSRCRSTCEDGFVLNGTANTDCTSLGTWSKAVPNCLAKRCPTLSSPSHGFLVCSGPHGEFSYGAYCTSTCEDGFLQIGAAETECTSAGSWSREMPQCQARPCPLLDRAPQRGKMNCIHLNSPFSYGSYCDFECIEGFWLKGTSAVACNKSGHWSQDLPTCQPVQCEDLHVLSLPLSMNCSHPLGKFNFGSQCLFTCEDEFSLNGSALLLCSPTGHWSDSVPDCIGMSMGTMWLLYAGSGAASAVAILGLIGLAFLLMKSFRKRGEMIMSDDLLWEDRKNPAFEF